MAQAVVAFLNSLVLYSTQDLPTDIDGWLATFERPMLKELTLEDQDEVISEIADRLRPVLCDSAGTWTADLVHLRFSARKP